MKREIERKNLQYGFNIYLLKNEILNNIDLLSFSDEEKEFFVSNIMPKIKLLIELESKKNEKN